MPRTTLSFQLWSSRKDPSLRNQLNVLRTAGYTDVQPHHEQYDAPMEFRDLLEETGLTARSAHINGEMLEARELERTTEIMSILGSELVIMPGLARHLIPTDREGWERLGERLSACVAPFRSAGMRFAWHNHGDELTALDDGSFPIEHILGADLLWEIDIGWTLQAGQDPSYWLNRYAGRIPAVHVKDVPKEGTNLEEDGQITIGAGVVDWEALWPRCVAAGATLMVAEHDQPLDYTDFAQGSIASMRALQAQEA